MLLQPLQRFSNLTSIPSFLHPSPELPNSVVLPLELPMLHGHSTPFHNFTESLPDEMGSIDIVETCRSSST
jgi:hypothetical protein